MEYILNDVFTTFLDPESGRCVAVYRRPDSSRISLKIILICVLKMHKGLTGLEQHDGE